MFATTDPSAIALSSLAWILADRDRAARFVNLTGMTGADLRTRIEDPALQRAVLDFLCAFEPDLIEAAAAQGLEPQMLAAAREDLAR